MFKKLSFLVIVCFSLIGCETQKNFTPDIKTQNILNIASDIPVYFAIYDGRSRPDSNTSTSIQNSMIVRYGDNLHFVNYFDKQKPNSILVKFRIVEMGSVFGSRVVSSVAYATAYKQAYIHASNGWDSILIHGSSNASVFGGSFTGEGWWIGSVWIDVDVSDRRNGQNINFNFPLVAEHKESNMLGYKSAAIASEHAWDKVYPQLLKVVDEILIKIINDE